jgi:sporulation protein YlmC with PRC-barrel domain
MPAALAQTRAVPDTRAPVTGMSASLSIQPDQMRASKMIGSTVYDLQNRDIGSVTDLVLDRDGRVAEVVVDVGSFLGIGGKYVAVGLSDLKSDNNRLTLDRTKEQLQQMTAYNLTNRNTGAGTTTSPATGGQLGR